MYKNGCYKFVEIKGRKSMIYKNYFLYGLIIILALPTFCSVHTTLLLTSNISGGSYVFQKESTAFGGKLNLNVIPAVKLDDKITFIPFYSLEYSGVKDVKELVGGGTLVQQYVTNTVYFKPVIKLSGRFKLKPKLGFTSQLIKETQDEEWTKGLFDYTKTSLSLELENKFSEFSQINILPGVFFVDFYNYKTLASQKYGGELSSVGSDILNFTATEFSIDYKTKLRNVTLQTGIYNLYKLFLDQYVINEIGEYTATKRNDYMVQLNFNSSVPIIPVGATTVYSSVGLNFVSNNSNQNHYDVERTKFVSDYYDYIELNVSPQIMVGFNTVPMNLMLNYSISSRWYSGRIAQESTGEYINDKINLLTQYVSLNLNFPIVEKLSCFIQQSYLSTTSNMKYEQVYKYNYTAYNIFVGLSFEY